jgi:ArsR family transcriptional regulator, lead/cadmium/zinc/bismuth-responsive transcriptional repressor
MIEHMSKHSNDTTNASCAERIIHPGAVRAAARGLPGPEELESMSLHLKALGDPTRLKILSALSAAELCVCDLGEALGMTVSAVSHQLAVLRERRLVRSRRDGKVVYYSLMDGHVRDILGTVRSHLGER